MGRRIAIRHGVVLLAGAALALGCVPRAQGFEDWTDAWTAQVNDRTGSVASIDVLDAAGPGPELAADAVRVQNVAPTVVEVAWLGGGCVDCAHFSLAPGSDAGIALRYDIGAACAVPSASGYALRIRFAHPVDAATITPIPDWGP